MTSLGLENKVWEVEKSYIEENFQDVIEKSTKMLFLINLLTKLQKEGHWVLLFTHSKVILNIFEEVILSDPEKKKKFTYFWIDGDVDIDIRD